MIQLLQNFNAVEQTLIINIMASTSSGDAIGSTVLVLNVPATEKSLKFSQPFYTGSYSAAAEPSIKLDNNINLTVVGYSGLQFFLGGIQEPFTLLLPLMVVLQTLTIPSNCSCLILIRQAMESESKIL